MATKTRKSKKVNKQVKEQEVNKGINELPHNHKVLLQELEELLKDREDYRLR